MGYYSDVKLITTEEGWRRIQHKVHRVSPDYAQDYVGEEFTVPLVEGKYILLEHHSIKWYDEFPEVEAIMGQLKQFDAEHIPYQFMRVGEHWDDNEYLWERDLESDEYDDMPYLELNRDIEVEY